MDYETCFDCIIDRRHTDNLKWSKYRGQDIIPMWIADMDFRCPSAVIDALHKEVDQSIFGYSVKPKTLNAVTAEWIYQRHQWRIHDDWIVWLPGLVVALNMACRGLTAADEKVCTFTPVYPPFLSAPSYMERELTSCSLVRRSNRYEIDFDAFETCLTKKTKLLLLCSPHNPIGRVWTRQELQRITEICLKHNVVICSDEIHCDLVVEPTAKHIPTASLDETVAQHTITLMAASKTFNVPGLGCAFAIVPNPEIRRQFRRASFGIVPHVTMMGYAATQAAFQYGKSWHEQLIPYLRGNRDLLHQAITEISGLSMDKPEATYLGWIDTRELGLENPVAFFEQAGVGLSDGAEFDGPGFLRINYGCPRAILKQGIERIRKAVGELVS